MISKEILRLHKFRNLSVTKLIEYGKLCEVISMKDFFTFYTDISTMDLPFMAFQVFHLLFLAVSILVIASLFRFYNHLSAKGQRKFQIGMAVYFVMEEVLYTIWLLLNCHDQVWRQILPLELCSLCVYMNALTVYLQKDYLKFFSGVVGITAGLVAIAYPVNISGLYPVVSYRSINFYILHSGFILFALIQLKNGSLLQYRYMKKNYLIVCCMFIVAFFVNLLLNTQYMFVGIPPKISFIASLYNLTGVVLFLPAVLFVISLIQWLVVFLLRGIYRKQRTNEALS